MNEELILQIEDDDELDASIDESIVVVHSNDYNNLINKPTINGVELAGNKTMNELLVNGLIIDGGSAEEVI